MSLDTDCTVNNLPGGPLDPEFQRRLALSDIQPNAIANCALLPGEPSESFLNTLRDHIARFGPIDGVAAAYIEEACIYYWWQRRGWYIHQVLFQDAMLDHNDTLPVTIRATFAFRDLAKGRALQLWMRYDAHLSRHYHRAIRDLISLQSGKFPNVN